MEKIKLKRFIGIIGAVIFLLSTMISHIPNNAVANEDPGSNENCSGSKIQCVSHLPDRLP